MAGPLCGIGSHPSAIFAASLAVAPWLFHSPYFATMAATNPFANIDFENDPLALETALDIQLTEMGYPMDPPGASPDHAAADGAPASSASAAGPAAGAPASSASAAGPARHEENARKKLKVGKDLWNSFAQHRGALSSVLDVPGDGAAAAIAPAPPENEFVARIKQVQADVTQSFAGCGADAHKLLCMTQYVCEATTSNYMFSNSQKLSVLMFIEGENWRSHEKQAFVYADGSWNSTDQLQVSSWDLLTALEGMWLWLEGSNATPWCWTEVKNQLVRNLAQVPSNVAEFLAKRAKEQSDVLRQATDNKVWKG